MFNAGCRVELRYQGTTKAHSPRTKPGLGTGGTLRRVSMTGRQRLVSLLAVSVSHFLWDVGTRLQTPNHLTERHSYVYSV